MFKNLEKIRRDINKEKENEIAKKEKCFKILCKKLVKCIYTNKREINRDYAKYSGKYNSMYLHLEITREESSLKEEEIIKRANKMLVGKGFRVYQIEKRESEIETSWSYRRKYYYSFNLRYIDSEIKAINNKNKIEKVKTFFKRIIGKILRKGD